MYILLKGVIQLTMLFSHAIFSCYLVWQLNQPHTILFLNYCWTVSVCLVNKAVVQKPNGEVNHFRIDVLTPRVFSRL